MKKTFIIIISFSQLNFSQTNRYTKVSTSTFKPLNYSAFERQARIKAKKILDETTFYAQKIMNDLESKDPLFVKDLEEAARYLLPLIDDEHKISVSEAEWYLKQVKQKYKKAIKNFNKRNRSFH